MLVRRVGYEQRYKGVAGVTAAALTLPVWVDTSPGGYPRSI